MKADTERTKRYFSALHQRKHYLHVHLSKPLRQKFKKQRRAILLHQGDKVRVLRGFARGKEAKVLKINYTKLKVYLEGITGRTARGREVPSALEPSNLLLLEMEPTPGRTALFQGETPVSGGAAPVVQHPASGIPHPASSGQPPESGIQSPASRIQSPVSGSPSSQNPKSKTQNQKQETRKTQPETPNPKHKPQGETHG